MIRAFHPGARVATPPARWRRTALAAALCVVASIASASPHASPAGGSPVEGVAPRITDHVIAAGGVSRARSACFDLASTTGQPVAGTSAGGGFTVTSGFLTRVRPHDDLLRTSFESCRP